VPEPFDDNAFRYELKHDGFRSLAYVNRGRVELVSRNAHVYRSWEPLRAGVAAALPNRCAILDGELVCLDDEGKSVFDALLCRRREPVFYCFDLLWLDGVDLRKQPLVQRKTALRRLVPAGDAHLFVADHIVGRGVDFFSPSASP